MRSFKKILCALLVVLTAFSAVVFSTVGATAAEVEGHSYLYFEVPDEWTSYSTIYCHIWIYGGEAFNSWQSKKEKCFATETEGVYGYDVTSLALTDDTVYAVIFSADTGVQTYDALFDTSCFGDTLYCDGTLYENPQDSSKTTLAAFWKNHDKAVYGPLMQITSIGNLIGTCLPPEITAVDLFNAFLTDWLEAARTYSGKDDQAIIDDIAEGLGLSAADISGLISDSGLEIAWTASPDEASPDESTPDESTPDEMLLRGDADLSGTVNIKDATAIQKYSALIMRLEYQALINADVDDNDDVNIKDATKIQKYCAELISEL